MENKNGDETKITDKKEALGEQRISDYVLSLIPNGALINFVFFEDFNNDGQKEAIIGYTQFSPFPPDSAVLMISKASDGFSHSWIVNEKSCHCPEVCVTFDNAAVADTDGDGLPELVLSQIEGKEHDIAVFIYDWTDNGMCLAWKSRRQFLHGSMETMDVDNDGIDEVIVECGTNWGSEIIEPSEACYHVRDGFIYKWNGKDYAESNSKVRMPYESYNIAVSFIRSIWLKEYNNAYKMVLLPGFLGVEGLDDSSLNAFKKYIIKKIRPVLSKNLSKGKLIPSEPYETCCQFIGADDCINVELIRTKSEIKIYGLEITKKHFFNKMQ